MTSLEEAQGNAAPQDCRALEVTSNVRQAVERLAAWKALLHSVQSAEEPLLPVLTEAKKLLLLGPFSASNVPVSMSVSGSGSSGSGETADVVVQDPSKLSPHPTETFEDIVNQMWETVFLFVHTLLQTSYSSSEWNHAIVSFFRCVLCTAAQSGITHGNEPLVSIVRDLFSSLSRVKSVGAVDNSARSSPSRLWRDSRYARKDHGYFQRQSDMERKTPRSEVVASVASAMRSVNIDGAIMLQADPQMGSAPLGIDAGYVDLGDSDTPNVSEREGPLSKRLLSENLIMFCESGGLEAVRTLFTMAARPLKGTVGDNGHRGNTTDAEFPDRKSVV